MPPLGPIKRKNFIRHLKLLGFEGPYSGGKHQFMIRDDATIRIPNPHPGAFESFSDLKTHIILTTFYEAINFAAVKGGT